VGAKVSDPNLGVLALASAATLKWSVDIDVTLAVADVYLRGFAGGRTASWAEMLEVMAQALRSEGYSIP
jgi:hypothetical protein